MFSRGRQYGEAPVHPYERNAGLECWWYEAIGGRAFRVYRNGRAEHGTDYSRAYDRGSMSGATPTVLTDAARAWGTEPQRHAGQLLLIESFSDDGDKPLRLHITSNTATTITTYGEACGRDLDNDGTLYSVYEGIYKTRVLDIQRMSEMTTTEIEAINRYHIEIPMLRYV
jgi:hypothetical protein